MSELHEVNDNEPRRAILVGVQLPGISDFENEQSLAELGRLVTTLGLKVVGKMSQRRSGTGSAMVLGEGKLNELARLTGGPGPMGKPVGSTKKPTKAARAANEGDGDDDHSGDDEDEFDVEPLEARGIENDPQFESEPDADERETKEEPSLTLDPKEKPNTVVFDCDLSPSQLRNVEAATGCQVLDRTGVIIEIFSRHARTRAARLQVEIARLRYLAPRLRETGGGDREGGGIGAKGAGETALELDKRKIRDRIKELKSEFVSIENEHVTRRARRTEVRTVALVGYTNAGKSSLMRALTGSEVYVADKLFATLDTTVRPVVPETRPAILISDTVGFIKKLPHDLVASFKSTLDEALFASLLLYVVDASDPTFHSQLEVTRSTLAEVGAGDAPSRLVLNKMDKLSSDERERLRAEFPEALMISTRSKDDVAWLREELVRFFEGDMIDEELFVPYNVKGVIGEIRARVRVLAEDYDALGVRVRVRGRPEDLDRIKARLRVDDY
jgi:GTP-binding protein HflX